MSQSVLIGGVVAGLVMGVALAIAVALVRAARNRRSNAPVDPTATPQPPAATPAPASRVQTGPRPTAHVNPKAVERTIVVPQSRQHASQKVALTGAPVLPSRREDMPEIVLATPVEMWLEEGRMGVRAGSPTHDQFIKYANTLLNDLQASRTTSR